MISELQIGVITQTHGIRGEVKVFPTTDDAARFKKLKEVIMDTGRERLDMEIEGVKFFKQYVILKFKGYDSINDVEKYKSAKLYVMERGDNEGTQVLLPAIRECVKHVDMEAGVITVHIMDGLL